ncbi:MAG TPA: cobalamin-dependent protein [Jatrophihabitans sp.]|nr:cobalamin-dependent protein [Jatrophihabitans sp.]
MSIESGGAAKDAERVAMLAALVDGDVPLAYRLAVELLAEGVPFDDIAVDVLAPVHAELGRRWAAGDLGVADEHAASAAIDDLLVRLGATVERPRGPAVVVASAENDAHALGGRVVASALALEGFRVMFLGSSVPASDLGDFLDLHRPLALALSCSMPTAFVAAARSVSVAHDLGIPVLGGGRALATEDRATRLGVDALARLPGDAVRVLRAWEIAPPDRFTATPEPIPETAAFVQRSHALVSAAIEPGTAGDSAAPFALADELHRVLQVVEGALLLREPVVIDEQVHWLRATGPARGFARADIDAALAALADAMSGDLQRAGAALRSSLS